MTNTNITKIKSALLFLLATVMCLPFLAHAAILYDGTQLGGVTNNDAFQIDFDQSAVTGGTNIDLQFGTSSRFLRWTGTKFQVSNDLDLGSNQITSARLENQSQLPTGLALGDAGRVIQLTGVDITAPGCTGGPSCSPGSYSWDGTTWHALQGTITTSNATKIITVGPTGRDYLTVAAGAAYLNTLSGGEMWIDPGTFPVTTSVDLSNIRVKGADASLTNITLSGAGKLTVKDTKFEDAKITIGAITANMGIDVKYVATSSSSVEFDRMVFTVPLGKFLIDSSAATKPVTIATFQNSSQTPTVPASNNGSIVRLRTAPPGIDLTSSFTIIDLLTVNPLNMSDWPVTIVGGSNVVTTGTITSVPDRTILVSPGMKIQEAINSLGSNGGVIKLLVGIHDVSAPIVIDSNNIKLTGEGPGTILRAQTATWPPGNLTSDDCVIQVGKNDGTTPHVGVIIDNFQLQVGPNVHGICVNGGSEDKVSDMIVQSIGAKSGTRTAIVFTDSATLPGERFTASRSIINSDFATDNWVDGVHFDGNNVLPGQLFGYNHGISDSIISEMIVNQSKETAYTFASVSASSVFSNRARNSCISANAFGMYFTNSFDVDVINNTIEGTTDATNTSTAISLANDVDNSVFVGNIIRGGPSINFNIGINIANSASSGNTISDNQISTTTTKLNNAGVATKLGTAHINSTIDPTSTDDNTLGYDVGTIWVNTTSKNIFVNASNATGAASWSPLTSGTFANTFVIDTDDPVGGENVVLQFGQTLNETLTWDNTLGHFVLNDDLDVTGALNVTGGVTAASADINGAANIAGPIYMEASDYSTALSGTVNNLAIPTATFVRLSNVTGNFTINSIAGGTNGRYLVLYNPSNSNMTIVNQSTAGASLAANKIIINTSTTANATVATTGTGTAIFLYDGTQQRWVLIAFTP